MSHTMTVPVDAICEYQTKDTNQTGHLSSLIRAFVVCCLDSIIPIVAISVIHRLAQGAGWFES